MESSLVSRVREVMAAMGLTQEEFASTIHTTPDKLSKSLGGKRNFTTLELALVAKSSGKTMDWLLTGITPERPVLAARVSLASAADESTVTASVERYYEASQQLARINGRHELKPLHPLTNSKQMARWATESLSSPVTELSNFDLAEAISLAFDVDVIIEQLPRGLDGFAWQTDTTRFIGVGTTPVWARQRFTLAHELGHILLHHAQELIAEEVPTKTDDKTEASANTFAANFLMPESLLRSELAGVQLSKEVFGGLATKFRVSPAALSWRLLNLGIIDGLAQTSFGGMTAAKAASLSQCSHFASEARADAQKSHLPKRILDAHIDAFQKGLASARPLAQLLQISPGDVIDTYGDHE